MKSKKPSKRKATSKQTKLEKSIMNSRLFKSKLAPALFMLSFAAIGMFLLNFGSAATVISTSKSGNWSDPSVWIGGKIPGPNDQASITDGHNVVYDMQNSRVSGLYVQVQSSLTFAPEKSSTLETDRNVIIEGILSMKPTNHQYTQTLRFVDINEEAFVGGGMDPVESDVGLWVVRGGKLDIEGTEKLGWSHAANAINQGATSFELDTEPSGWQVGDEVSIAPTNYGDTDEFDVKTVTSISGRTITVNSGMTYGHPSVPVDADTTLTAEVMNLTRNVRIEGEKPEHRYPRSGSRNTSKGRSHILIRNTEPVVQNIKHVGIRHMGPRQYNSSRDTSVRSLGRYGLHFHMSHENNRGTVVEGTVIRDTDSHAYVPHTSHGITFYDTVSYNTSESAYWWDVQSDDQTDLTNDRTDDIVYDKTIAALADVDFRGDIRLAGYSMAVGMGNVVKDSVAVGITGRVQASGFLWPEGANGSTNNYNSWRFDTGNISHNNETSGIFTWQNDPDIHIIRNVALYHNGCAGIDHGAYINHFVYSDMTLYRNRAGSCSEGSEVILHSTTRPKTGGGPTIMSNLEIDTKADYALHIARHRVAGEQGKETRLENWNILNYEKSAVLVNERGSDELFVDFVCWTLPGGRELEPSDFAFADGMEAGSIYRIQRRNGTAYRLMPDGSSQNISAFSDGCPPAYPISGTGDGFLAEYFSQNDFTNKVGERKDPTINAKWYRSDEVFPNLSADEFSVIWTGQIQPLFSEDYTFYTATNKDMTVYIDDKLVIDNSFPKDYWTRTSKPVSLKSMQKYDIRIELKAGGDRTDAEFIWQSKSQPVAHVNEFQLYSSSATASILGDLDGNGTVDTFDLSLLLSNYGTDNGDMDLNGNGTVDVFDLSILLSNWGKTA